MTDRLNNGGEKPPKRTAQEWCDLDNRKLLGIEPTVKHHLDAPRHDIEWVVVDNRPTIRWKKSPLVMLNEDRQRKPVMDRRGQPMSESDTFALNKELERLGSPKRYRSDGTKYDAESAQ